MIAKRMRPFSGLQERLEIQIKNIIKNKSEYSLLSAPFDLLLNPSPGGEHVLTPNLAVLQGASHQDEFVTAEKVILAVDVDVQACGGSPDFTKNIRIYQAARALSYWIIYPKDEILVLRLLNEESGAFHPPKVFGESDRIGIPGLEEEIPVSSFLLR